MFENPSEHQIRFDVIEVYYKIINNDELILDEINHIKNAFYDISNYI